MSVQGALAKVRRIQQLLQAVIDIATPETFAGIELGNGSVDAIAINVKRAHDAATNIESRLRMKMCPPEQIVYKSEKPPSYVEYQEGDPT